MVFNPGYVQLLDNGVLLEKVEEAKDHFTSCRLCPHECGVDRTMGKGFCKGSDKALVASYGPHFGEEDVLVGSRGSGTIFFGYCNMRCVFCQNCDLSFGGEGKLITNEELADIMLYLQNHYRCHNINLVTPTHFVPNILEALYIAALRGLRLPLVYNCGGYEKIETLHILDGIIDIYMPDFKYDESERSRTYSQILDYPEKSKIALKEMDRQVGGAKVDERGIAYRGLLIRHLILPGGLEDTKKVLEFIKLELSADCLVNLMDQYYPAHKAFDYAELSKRLSPEEYRQARAFAQELGLNII